MGYNYAPEWQRYEYTPEWQQGNPSVAALEGSSLAYEDVPRGATDIYNCPFCGIFQYSILDEYYSPVEIFCPVCRITFLHYLLRGICERRQAPQLRAFVLCSIWGEDKWVADDFRERLSLMGILPRTVGIDHDIKASNNAEALVLAKEEIRKVDFILAIEVPRYYIDGFLPSIWTVGIEPGMGTMIDKPIYVFKETGVRLDGPLEDMALEVIEFDRNTLGWETENERINEWLFEITSREKQRQQGRTLSALLKGTSIVAGGALVLIGLASSIQKARGAR